LQRTPAGGPKAVEEARQAELALVAELPKDRAGIDTAKTDLLKTEKADREAQALGMREQREVSSDIEGIARKREEVAAAERRHAARRLAIETADQELGEAVRACSDEWLRSELRTLARAHARALKAVDALDTAFDELGRVRGVVGWLEHGLERGQPAPRGGLLSDAKSSAFAMANNSPASRASLMAWVRELAGDPPAQAETRTHRQAATVAGGG
jgi:hypothetical protein